MNHLTQNLQESLLTGFIDKSIISHVDYQPELLVNQIIPPKKVLTNILHELENCTKFYFSVAFVTTSGIASIINELKILNNNKIPGKILVSQYLNFTQPEALKRLIQFDNIEVRIATTGNVHSKVYLFEKKEYYNLIIGSSNLTAQALSTNKEWNIKISALSTSGIIEKVLQEFHNDFSIAKIVSDKFIIAYDKLYSQQIKVDDKKIENPTTQIYTKIRPNNMQIEALENLQKIRKEGKDKALIISATGTGKTFLSAFDSKSFNSKRLLFIVHRLTIAKDALNTFNNVYEGTKSMGVYSGNNRELECEFIFSTIQTISKTNHLENFQKNHFDYIVIDETHRSGAESYLRIINYFKPKFLLGMTATPERTDGTDIFQLFDYNIAYEIRLSKAMDSDMLSSFHYYGIADLSIDAIEVESTSDFKYLIAEERIERIIEQIRFYGCDNGMARGIIFCSRKKEAIELSKLFNMRGFRSIALTGEHSEEERAIAIERLETDILDDKLDYIFTVDIFNEGIDIPKVNQIIMLRPTKSIIVFIQQLGRGLRKADGKDYLTVLDFIGNYENNYLIPIALYGETSYNKDSLRKLLSEGSKMIPGSSTVNFDEITKERIYQSIDSANLQLYADLKKDFSLLKYKLGRIPMMMDFIEHGSRNPYLYVDYANSYYNFILKVERIENTSLSSNQMKLLELFSKEINNSKRVEESLMLQVLIRCENISIKSFKDLVFEKLQLYTLR